LPVVPIVSVAGISVVVFVVSSAVVSAGSLEHPATRASGAAANQSKIFIAIRQAGGLSEPSDLEFVPRRIATALSNPPRC
jgi:hypothetical protein